MSEAAVATGVSKQSICTWYSKCRNFCSTSESTLPKLKGTIEQPIETDESYFSGRRKNNKGWLAVGDKRPTGEKEAAQEMEIEFASWSL